MPGNWFALWDQMVLGSQRSSEPWQAFNHPLSGQITYNASKSPNPHDLPRHLAVVLTDRITAGNMTVSGRHFLWPLSLPELDRRA